MPHELSGERATLVGNVAAEEAEDLAEFFRRAARPEVDLSGCSHLHTAVLQVLLAARPSWGAPPSDPFLGRFVMPLVMSDSTEQECQR